MAAPQLFKLAGRIASRMADKSADSGLARMEKIFGTPPKVPFPTTAEKIARGDAAFARGPVEYSRYRGPMEDVDEVILDAPLNISEREYFRNLPRTGSGFTEKKLTAKDVEFFEDMMREGDPYDFMADIPSAKIRTDKKGNKYLRVQGEEDMNNLFKFIMDGPWDKGDLPPSLRRWDWDKSFKDVKEFKHGGGLSSINKPITINGQPHSLAWIRPDEASALKAMGGSGKKVGGIPAYFGVGGWDTEDVGTEIADTEAFTYESPPTVAEQISSYMDYGGADIVGGTTSQHFDQSTGESSETDPKDRRGYLRTGGEDPKFISVTGGFGERDDPGALGEFAYGQTPGHWRLPSSAEGLLGIKGPDKKEGFYRVAEKDDLAKFGKEGYEQSRNAHNFQNIFYSTLHKDIRDDKEDLDDEEKLEKIIKAAEKAEEAIPGATFSKSKKLKGLYEDLPDKGAVNKLLKRIGPGALPSKLIAGAANALADLFGVIGIVEINGKGYHVKKDGTISIISPEDDPGYNPSQHHEPGSDVPEQEQKSTPAPAVAEAPPEKGPMQTYQEGLTSIESNQGLINSFRILKGQYPHLSAEEILKMLGKDINEIDISEFDINE